MKSILLVSDKFPPHIGGMETHAYEFLKYFQGRREDYRLQALSFLPEETPDSIAVAPQKDLQVCEGVEHVLPYDSIFDAKHLDEWLQKNPTDTIFFNSLYWVRIFETLRKTHDSLQMIMRSGGTDIRQSKIRGKGETLEERQRYVVSALNDNLDHLMITTQYVRETFRALGVEDELMKSYIGGVDAKRFLPTSAEQKAALREELEIPVPADAVLLLSVSRFIPVKGISYCLDAMAQAVSQTKEPLYFLLIGGGPLEDEVRASIRDLGLQGKVILKKSVPVSEIHKYYAAADVYFQMSTVVMQQEEGGSFETTEHMGRSLMEAQAAGLPIVATSVGGIPEAIEEGQAGFLVNDKDAAAAALRLVQLAQDPLLRQRLGQGGRERAEKQFDWPHVFQSYEQFF
ncbi:MAG: glycosyltransferase family 4 protein [Candidatus Peregrinibacteria bacterium]|nr:glycosyltransferase family 4 protein [Candidatus Peregrinibacteria bacterium]